MAQSFEQKLCSILVAKKVLTEKDAQELHQQFQDRSKETFDNFLLSEGLVTKENLLSALSEYYQVPSFDVVGHFFKHDLLREFPQDVLVHYGMIPLERDGELLVIVASQPDSDELLPELAEYVSDEIQFYVGIKNDIIDAVMEYYQDSPFVADEQDAESDEDSSDMFSQEDVELIDDDFESSDAGEE